MAQKVYLNNEDKLIIETDNGRIDANNNQTTELRGKFEIEAGDLAKIAAVLNDVTFEMVWVHETPWGHGMTWGYGMTWGDNFGCRVISNDKAIATLQQEKKELKELADGVIESKEKEIYRLQELIDNHNKKCIFKFRKINY